MPHSINKFANVPFPPTNIHYNKKIQHIFIQLYFGVAVMCVFFYI